MIWLAIAILSLLAFFNYRLGGKALLFPPFVFCAVWTASLLIILCAGDFFYSLHAESIFIFICGAAAFTAGSWLARWFLADPRAQQPISLASNRILNWMIVAVVISAVFFYRWWGGVLGHADNEQSGFFSLAKLTTLQLARSSWTFWVFHLFVELSRIVAMLAFYDRENHPKRAAFVVVLAFILNSVFGTKYGPVSLALSLFAIYWMETKRIRWQAIALLMTAVILISSAFLYYLGSDAGSFVGTAPRILGLLILYAIGGLVNFDQFLQHPGVVPQEMNPFTVYYLHIAQKFGAHVYVPATADFVNIGPHSLAGNVYTMYWSYVDLGFIGVFGLTAFAGFLATLIYQRAFQGSRVAVMLYTVALYGIIFSGFNESLFSEMLWISKVGFVAWMVYYGPIRWQQFRAMLFWRIAEVAVRAEIPLAPKTIRMKTQRPKLHPWREFLKMCAKRNDLAQAAAHTRYSPAGPFPDPGD